MRIKPGKHRGKEVFILDSISSGVRKRQYFQDRESAEKALEIALEDREDIGKAWGVLSAREKVEIMATINEIKEAGTTLEHVWKFYKNAPQKPRSGCTLQRALTELIAAKKAANCRQRTIDNLDWYLGLFIKGREQMDVCQIGERELNDWFIARNEKPVARKGHMNVLSALFTHCWKRRYIAENPVRRLDAVILDQAPPAILTVRQCQKAMIWSLRRKPELLAWLALTLFCGMRPDAEADFIDWDAIDLTRGRIMVNKSKIRTLNRIIDLSFCPPALEWLKLAKEKKSPLPLAHGTRRKYIRQLKTYLRMERWPQDVLRHTAASYLLAYHQDAGKVASFLGHSVGTLLRHYKALVFKEEGDRYFRLFPKLN